MRPFVYTSKSQLARFFSHLLAVRIPLCLALGVVAFMLTTSNPPAAAQGGMQWYMVDLHTHSVVSAEAFIDVGIHSTLAQSLGYDAIFLTDHNGASSFQINNITANNMYFEDAYTRWELGTFGSLSSTTNSLATTAVNSGATSLRLRSVSSQYGETHVWTKRGPTLRSGTITLQVSIYPVRIDPNSGAYVSVSIGGDLSTSKTPDGYTTAASAVSPGKSTVLVWQLGNARVASSDPNARILVYPLSYTLNTWNHYTINVSAALNDIPAADRPLDYNALTYLKMAVGADSGTAEAYFDTYSVIPSAPVASADEYIYRTSVVDDFDTANFKIFPSYEVGQQRHTQRFNFGITDPSQYISYLYGTDSIPDTHQSGYPAQINHPGVTVTEQDAVTNLAYGADFLEAREDAWVTVWDAILAQNVPIIGTWTSDTHSGLSAGKGATFVYAPNSTFDALLKALFEGRSYNALNTFTGQVIFNLGNLTEPYPARYPVYVSDADSSINLSLNINGSLSSSWTISWMRNGVSFATDSPTGSTYQATKAVALSGATTVARAQVRSSSTSLRAGTQAILFRDIVGLPAGRRIYVTEVTTTDGRNYTNDKVKGITTANWGASTQILQLLLENPLNALTRLQMVTSVAPQRVKVGGVQISSVASLAAFTAATTNAWYYDTSAQSLYLKVAQATATTQLDLEFGSAGDTTPPTVPTNVSATALNLSRIDLTWSASTDNLAVGGYTIRRDGVVLTTVNASTVSYSDLTVQPATPYNYTVDAFDTSNNFSAQSTPAVATTPNSGVFTFSTVADAYVDNSVPISNFGTATTFRADASPIQRSYIQFNLQGLIGTIVDAKLRIFAETASPIGYQIGAVSDNGWSETGINFNNAPAIGTALGSVPSYGASSWTEVNVTPQVTGNGLVSFALSTTSNTGLRYTSRQGISSQTPQLVVTVMAGIDTPPTVSVTNPANGATVAGSVNVTANASDDNGVTQVEFFVGGVSIGIDTTAPYAATWDTTTTTGNMLVSATAKDAANQSSSSAVTVIVDNPPAVNLTNPANGATVLGTINVTANASDNNAVTQVEFFVNGASIGVDATAPYEASWNTTTTANGTVTVSATARDTVNQTNSNAVNVTVNNPPSDTPPTVSVTNPANGATVAGAVNVTADASDNNGVTQVEFFVGDVSIGVDTTVPYEATWDTTTTAEGAATVSATATDTANQSSSSAVNVTVDNGSPGGGVLLYVSSDSNGNVGGIAFADEDILTYDMDANVWRMFYDGTDVSGGTDVDAFYRLADGSMLLSFDAAIATLAGVGAVDDSDIVRFVPSSTGAITAGVFSLYLRGATFGLTTNSEDISAITLLANSDLIVGTSGNFSVTGASGTDEDLLRFTPTTPGTMTSGTWSLYFDGSDVELNTSSTEKLYGVWVDDANGDIYLTTQDAFAVTGAAGVGSDIFACRPGSLGATTSCTYSFFWNGAAVGFGGERTDSLHIGQSSEVALAGNLDQGAIPQVQEDSLQPEEPPTEDETEEEPSDESTEDETFEIYLPVIQNQ